MRPIASLLLSIALGLAGCASAPDLATLPHATVSGTHVNVDGDRYDTFRVLYIDGTLALPRVDEPVKLLGKDTTSLLPPGRPVRLEVEGFAFYKSTAHRIIWDAMRAQGVIEFVPAADATYALHGTIAPEASSIWLEDEATHQPVGRRITMPGRAASGADAPPPARRQVEGA